MRYIPNKAGIYVHILDKMILSRASYADVKVSAAAKIVISADFGDWFAVPSLHHHHHPTLTPEDGRRFV